MNVVKELVENSIDAKASIIKVELIDSGVREIKVTDEEVEHELYHIQNDFAEIKIVEDGELKEGQIAIIDFEGFKDGKAFDGVNARGGNL